MLLDANGLTCALLGVVDDVPRSAPDLARRTGCPGTRRVSPGQATVLLLQLSRTGDVIRHEGATLTYTRTPAGELRYRASRTGLPAAAARTLLALDGEAASGAEVARRVQASYGGELAVTYAPLYRLVTLGLATRTGIEFGDGYARSEAGEGRVQGARLVMDYVARVQGEAAD